MPDLPPRPFLLRRSLWRGLFGLAVTAGLLIASFPRIEAYWHWREARTAIRNEDFEAARAHLAICQRERPSHAAYSFEAARIARREKDYRTAQLLLKRAADLGYAAPEIRLEEQLASVAQHGWRGNDPPLLECVERHTADEARIREVLADAYYRDLQLRPALEQAEEWTRLEPGSAMAWQILGDIRLRSRNRAGAGDAFREAIERNPSLFPARARYAAILLALGRPEEASSQFEEAIRQKPRDRDVRVGWLQCQIQLNRIEDTHAVLGQLVIDYPKDPKVAAVSGQLALRSGNAVVAEQFLRVATADAPDLPVLQDLQKALARQNKVDEARALQTRIDGIRKDFDRLDELTRSAQSSFDPAPRVEVGTILIRNGLASEGEAWLYAALRYDPRFRPAHSALAEHFANLGREEQAEHHRRMAGAK